MTDLRNFVDSYPRMVAGCTFGICTTCLTYFSWIPNSSGKMEGLPLAAVAGMSHAVAASITGNQIIHPSKAPRLLFAGLWGGGTSLLALFLFSLGTDNSDLSPTVRGFSSTCSPILHFWLRFPGSRVGTFYIVDRTQLWIVAPRHSCFGRITITSLSFAELNI